MGRNQGLSAVTADLSSIDGTVTRVDGVGSVNGLTLGGSITTNGDLTLGGTLAINNDDWSGTDLSIVNGGTGQGTAQNAINSLSQVSSATNEHVLTKIPQLETQHGKLVVVLTQIHMLQVQHLIQPH